MDNQQGNDIELNLAWLAGFIDGEGSLMLRRLAGKKMRNKEYNYYYPSIRICNTHEATLTHVLDILKSVGLPCHVSRRYPTNHYLPSWDVEVRGLKRCKRWLSVILPYLVTKREEGEAMLKFINLRLANDKHEGYSEEEEALIRQLLKRARYRPHRLHATQE